MTRLIVGRIFALVVTLVVTAVAAFVLLDLVPGDPALNMLGTEAREDTLAAARHLLGLDRPPLERMMVWLLGIPGGDFGVSFRYRVPVAELLAQSLSVTAPLGLMAIAITVAVALPLALLAVAYHRRWPDTAISVVAQCGLATPNFWVAILLILVFSIGLGWFDASGFPGWAAPLAALKALVLPAVALALPQAAILLRVSRAAILEVAREDYVRTARAKGLTQRATLLRHVLGNAMMPILTIMGLQLAVLLAGSIIVENVFVLPGLGRLVFQAIQQNDLIVVRNAVLVIATMVLLINFAVDLCYLALNPRLRAR
jgi:peptide/nickel transport system permease protein